MNVIRMAVEPEKLKISPETAALIGRRPPGRPLEAPFYTRREIFEIDMKLIFGQHWIYVAAEAEIPEPGDYVTIDLLKNSIVLVRDDNGEVKAFHNVCRHRGSRLCNEHTGSVGNLVCPYHQWTYDLEGKLLFAEHMGEDFDRSAHSLRPVHLQNLAGLLFICLADTPPADFADMRAAMEPYLLPHHLHDTKVAAQVDIIEECNWKLTIENNRECYHCAANHPELTASIFEYGFGYQASPSNQEQLAAYDKLVATRTADWEGTCGLPSVEVEHLDDRTTGFRTQRLPLDQGGESETLDAKVASQKLLGEFRRADLGALSFWTQPNSWHHFMSDHIVTFQVFPLSENRTLVRSTWLVHKDAVENVDYTVDNLTAVWNATNAQDRHLVEISQKGIESDAYEPGMYSPYAEVYVEKFCRWYIDRLAALTTA